jgi:hypothetical protein
VSRSNDGGSKKNTLQISFFLHQGLFSHTLGVSIGIWEIPYELLFVLGHLLWIHGHESLDSVINIHIEIIDFLLDVSSRSVAVDIGGGHVSEHLELFAFVS